MNMEQQRLPANSEVRERVIRLSQQTIPNKNVDKTYKNEIAKYKEWVDKEQLEKVNGKYLSRDNVDLYFTQVQQSRLVTHNTGRRVVSALQSFADNDEYLGSEVGFIVDCQHVRNMLKAQTTNKTKHVLNTGRDYHVKLSIRNMTYNEKRQITRYVLKDNKRFWSDFLTTWNCCNMTFSRVDTVRKFVLKDLLIDNNHSVGALKQDPHYEFDGEMLGVILRPFVHKERSSETHVIGAYRHKDPYMCFTGCLAMKK